MIVTVAALLCAQVGALGADNSLQAVYDRMDQASTRFKGLKADMKKVTHTDILNENSEDLGTIAVRVDKPHNFQVLIDFKQPDAKTLSLAGTKLQVYYPKSNTVQELDLGKGHKAMVESFVLLGFGSNSKDIESAYTVRLLGAETVTGQKTEHLELIPKAKEVSEKFPKFELWISDQSGIAVQQKMYETGGKDYSVATYSNMQVGPVSDADVKLNLPKNVTRERPQR